MLLVPHKRMTLLLARAAKSGARGRRVHSLSRDEEARAEKGLQVWPGASQGRRSSFIAIEMLGISVATGLAEVHARCGNYGGERLLMVGSLRFTL